MGQCAWCDRTNSKSHVYKFYHKIKGALCGDYWIGLFFDRESSFLEPGKEDTNEWRVEMTHYYRKPDPNPEKNRFLSFLNDNTAPKTHKDTTETRDYICKGYLGFCSWCHKGYWGHTCFRCCDCLPFCCGFFHMQPILKIMVCGRTQAGKTTLLRRLLLQGKNNPKKKQNNSMQNALPSAGPPTFGYNNEVVTFNKWQRYEIFDMPGTKVQRQFWRNVYTKVKMDVVIYVLNATAWIDSDCNSEYLDEDRSELKKLLAERELRPCNFILYLIFKDDSLPVDKKFKIESDIQDRLELSQREITSFTEYDALIREIKVDTDIHGGVGS